MRGEMFHTTLHPAEQHKHSARATPVWNKRIASVEQMGLQVWNTWNASVAEMIEFQSYPQKYPSMKIMREI